MTLRKGNFHVYCDHEGCDEAVDLGTDEFEEALRAKRDNPEMDGWTTYGKGGFNRGFNDFCPAHDPYRNRR